MNKTMIKNLFNSIDLYNIQKGGMQFEDDKSGYGGDQNIEEMLEDLAIGEESLKEDMAKKDSTIFAIDCSP